MNTSALLTSDAKDNVESGCRLNQITLQFHLKKNIFNFWFICAMNWTLLTS